MKYGFLFNSTQLPKTCLRSFLQNDAFVAVLDDVMAEKHHISDEDIYEALKIIYYPLWLKQDRSAEAGMMNRTLRAYAKSKYGDAKIWRNEFIALSESGATEYEEP